MYTLTDILEAYSQSWQQCRPGLGGVGNGERTPILPSYFFGFSEFCNTRIYYIVKSVKIINFSFD